MIEYDRNKPVIFVHVPKSAGISLKSIFRNWFGDNLYFHYYDNNNGILPVKHDLDKLHSYEHPVAVYGHFNRQKKFGVEDYYPEVSQFITVLRDPFERHISLYYYLRKIGQQKYGPVIEDKELEDWLLNSTGNYFTSFPCEINMQNYKEIIEKYFIEVGIVEKLDESLKRIAQKLGFPYSSSDLKHLNTTERSQAVPTRIKDEYRNLRELEYTVYEYALSKYA